MKATVERFRKGKQDKTALYCQTKSGNVYRYPKPLTPRVMAHLMVQVTLNHNHINTKNWTKVRDSK